MNTNDSNNTNDYNNNECSDNSIIEDLLQDLNGDNDTPTPKRYYHKRLNVKVKLYCGQPGTGKSTLLRKLYQQYDSNKEYRQVILCPTNQLISTYKSIFNESHNEEDIDNVNQVCQFVSNNRYPNNGYSKTIYPNTKTTSTISNRSSNKQSSNKQSSNKQTSSKQSSSNVQTLYKLLKLTPKSIPSKHLKNFEPLFKKTIMIPNIIYIDEVFMFSFQEIWALLKCIQIKQQIQKTVPYQVELHMFGDPFQLKCCATSMAQQENIKQGGDGKPIYWYHAFEDFGLTIETTYLKKLWRFDTEFANYIISLKQMWKKDISGNYMNNLIKVDDEQNNNIQPFNTQTTDIQPFNTQLSNPSLSNITLTKMTLPFDVIDLLQIGKYVSQGYVILVGTHIRQAFFQKKLFQYFRNSVIHGKDGKSYRLNGPVYTLSQLGGSYQNKCTIKSYDEITGEFIVYDETKKQDIVIKPKKGETIKYGIAPGDVLTVNVVQGRELPGVIIDMQSLFEFGSFYTAISRCKKIQNVKLISVSEIGYPDLQNDYVLKELLEDGDQYQQIEEQDNQQI